MARETDGRERNVFGYLTHEFETFEQRPLGDVDSLVLACLSYFQLPPEAEAAAPRRAWTCATSSARSGWRA